MLLTKNWKPAAVITTGILFMMYPFISNWLYSRAVQSEVTTYEAAADEIPPEETERLFAAARAYNEQLQTFHVTITDPFIELDDDEKADDYYEIFNLDGSGLMCFVEIPEINVCLPVYHGTDAMVLEKGAGHMQGTAFPTGDEGIRPVISAHTDINKAKMFSDLTEIEEGDLFFLTVTDEIFAYEVCDIQVILPEDVSTLTAEEGRDLVTLMTCTPYGINTHRLIVTGERTDYVENMEESIAVSSEDSRWMSAYRRLLLLGTAATIGIALVRIILFERGRRKAAGVDRV